MSNYRLQRTIGRNSSLVTKGKRMFVEQLADGRTQWARRRNDLVLMHAGDLGGNETLSEAQISICRRVATLECELESMEGRMSAGVPIEIEVYGRLASRLCRTLELISVKRLARPLDPTSDLAKGLEAYAQKPVDDDEPDDDEPAAIRWALPLLLAISGRGPLDAQRCGAARLAIMGILSRSSWAIHQHRQRVFSDIQSESRISPTGRPTS